MKHPTRIFFALMFPLATFADPCNVFTGSNVMTVTGATTFTFNHGNPDHWSWNADLGDAVIQDNGWVYFDGNGETGTSTIRIAYNNGGSALVQPPNGRNGWCTLKSGAQNNIQNVVSWG